MTTFDARFQYTSARLVLDAARSKFAEQLSVRLQRCTTDADRQAAFAIGCRRAVDDLLWSGIPEHRKIRFAVLRKVARADGANTTDRWFRWLTANGWALSYRRGQSCIESRKFERLLRIA